MSSEPNDDNRSYRWRRDKARGDGVREIKKGCGGVAGKQRKTSRRVSLSERGLANYGDIDKCRPIKGDTTVDYKKKEKDRKSTTTTTTVSR